ncbi:MAG: hypothetical protein ACON4U_13300 [Myxococcota bacterium]
MNPLPWKLRLYHHGFAHISLSWEGRDIHFCPIEPIEEDAVAVVLWSWPEHLQGCIDTLKQGRTLTLVAPPEIIDYLSTFGRVIGSSHFEEAGLVIDLHPYEPIPEWSIRGGAERIKAGLQRPFRTLRRLHKKRQIPPCEPHIANIIFPSGARLVHLNTALHNTTVPSQLTEWSQQFGDPDWTLSGLDVGHHESWYNQIVQFTTGAILLCDLLGDSRRRNGMSTPLLTPIVDTAVTKNINAFVFATYASYRYDTVDLISAAQ